jgi:hypothetical protein
MYRLSLELLENCSQQQLTSWIFHQQENQSPERTSALARSDPPLLSKTDPGGLWLSLEGQVTLLQMAIPEGRPAALFENRQEVDL